jgi:hypothetical protein
MRWIGFGYGSCKVRPPEGGRYNVKVKSESTGKIAYATGAAHHASSREGSQLMVYAAPDGKRALTSLNAGTRIKFPSKRPPWLQAVLLQPSGSCAE